MLHQFEEFDPCNEEMFSADTDEMQVVINDYYEGKITAEQLEKQLDEISLRNTLMSQFWDIFTHDFRRKYETPFIYDKLRTKQLPTTNN